MTLRERLRSIVDATDPAGSVTVSCAWLRAQLDADSHAPPVPASEPAAIDVDLTVPQLAALFGRGSSTVRTWIEDGLFPNAYKLKGREWRVPRADIEAVQKQQREAHRSHTPPSAVQPAKDAGDVDLSSWRKHVRT